MMYVKCHTAVKDVIVSLVMWEKVKKVRLLTEDVLKVNLRHGIFTIEEG
ncbi:hypothetical protein V7149_09800 [Bacillus sp. JJ1503]